MRGVFMVAKVAISRAAYSFDCEYSYMIPEGLREKIAPGMRVLVPFGKGNRKSIGFVTRVYEETDFDEKLKPIISLIDDQSLVTDEMMKIIMWLKENTFCTYYDAIRTLLPSALQLRVQEHYSLVPDADTSGLDAEQKQLLQQIFPCLTTSTRSSLSEVFLQSSRARR